MKEGKRSKIRFLYYVSYIVMGSLLKLMTIANNQIQFAPLYQRFFWSGITYKNYRIMMADLEVRDKMTHDLILFVPNSFIFIVLAIIIGW